ncbi:hypothetical protein OB236_09235 [Paenibacillus sp. WQ 127069]|uniref:Transposase n=1 Tax=Paenibacillus baimaensis TaxID=2982185 RepID=A0ABT2UE81_9BACL|nr:hypothetical protein [Paenibacillus sp. WQ 127069]
MPTKPQMSSDAMMARVLYCFIIDSTFLSRKISNLKAILFAH